MAPVLFLYGTEKGNAQGICEELIKDAKDKGFEPTVDKLNNYEKVGFGEASLVIMVCSTTGEGEPPESARKFWRWLKKKTHPEGMLKGLRYAMLGLGDTNYSKFCNGAKMIDQRLLELGAERFFNTGCADDGVGLEVVVEPWRTHLWPALAAAVSGAPPPELPADVAATLSGAPPPAPPAEAKDEAKDEAKQETSPASTEEPECSQGQGP